MASFYEQDTTSDSTEEDFIIPDYETCLGTGSFGVVYKGKYGGREVAVKVINKHMLINKGKYKNIDKNEIIPFLKGLRHPNIISILALEDRGHELWLAMELCNSSLYKYLEDNDPDLSLTYDILCQGATGLAYLHDNNIIHRDLRPDNQLIIIKDSHPIIKITDFSLCKDIAAEPTSSMTTVWGNRSWIAPELLTEDGSKTKDVIRYKRSIDIFSYGLVILYVCVYDTGRKIINSICCGARVKRGEDVLDEFKNFWRSRDLKERLLPLLQRMLTLDPEARPPITEAIFQPPIIPTPPRLRHLASHSLGYDADTSVGINEDSWILLGREDTETFQLLQLKDGVFHKVWEKPCPPGVRVGDKKYIVGETIATRDYVGCNPTRCWNLDLQRLHEHEVGDHEDLVLVSCLSQHVMVYSEEIEEDSYQLVLHGGCAVPRLQSPAGSLWDADLSVCQHSGTGWFAVCEAGSRSHDVFDETGRHHHHVTLPYKPDPSHSICCTSSHLIISEACRPPVLHIHAWSGQEVGTVELQQMRGMGRLEEVHGISVCDGGRTLIVASGVLGWVDSLHALTIHD